jgi:hypothetical protein
MNRDTLTYRLIINWNLLICWNCGCKFAISNPSYEYSHLYRGINIYGSWRGLTNHFTYTYVLQRLRFIHSLHELKLKDE